MDIICYNLGMVDVCLNGDDIQLSYCREDYDSEWTRGKVEVNNGNRTDEVGFFYNILSPMDARDLAKQLIAAAEESEKKYNDDPIYIALENDVPMFDTYNREYIIYFNKDEAEKEIRTFQESTNEDYVYSYRPLTVQEYWKWRTDNIIE